MRNRTPAPPAERPPLPAFTPVPRKNLRHDGWTPERQRAFIQALAETGSVTTAARMVNMAHATAYALRHHPEAGEFRAAWDAALRCGVQRLRDEAFDRAMNGQLQPVFWRGQVVGYRRVKNDRLLMHLLRHYGQDAAGKRVTLNYFAAPKQVDGGELHPTPLPCGERVETAQPARGEGPNLTLPTPDHPPTPLPAGERDRRRLQRRGEGTDPAPDPARTVAAFAGVPLDDQAQAEIVRALEACAARLRDEPVAEDPDVPYLNTADTGYFAGGFVPFPADYAAEPFTEGESRWESLCEPDRSEEIAAAVEAVGRAEPHGVDPVGPETAKPGRRAAG